MKVAVVDFQGFIIDGNFQPKEICIKNIFQQIAHFIVKPAVEFSSLTARDKKQARWLENNYHGLKYNCGSVELCDVGVIFKRLLSDIDIVYVKGNQKRKYLMELGLPLVVIDLKPQDNPPKLTMQQPMCMYHDGNVPRMCSMTNCKDLFDWLCNVIPY